MEAHHVFSRLKKSFLVAAGVLILTITLERWDLMSMGFSSASAIQKIPSDNNDSSPLPLPVPTRIRAVQNILKCSSSQDNIQNGMKLIFIHVFKAAGNLMQHFFLDYARICNIGWAHIHSCTDVKISSMQNPNGYWINRKRGRRHCPVPEYVVRHGGGNIRRSMRGLQTSWIAEHMDMIGGHMPLGTHILWKDTPRNDVRYVSFFRDAVEKYVSAVKYSNHLKNMNATMQKIKGDMEEAIAEGRYHQTYSRYLMTPQQKQLMMGGNITTAIKARQVMENIVDFDIVVGMTDRMSESMQIIQRLIDIDESATPLFDKYGLLRGNSGALSSIDSSNATMTTSEDGGVHMNVASLPTSAVIDEIKKDEKLYAKVVEFVKYEQQITDFARAIHMRQYASLYT